MARRSHQRRTQPKSQRPRSIGARPPFPRSPADKRTRALWWTVAITALVLLLTIDDRYPGAIADGRQMAWTAIAITETGEIGQARGRDFTWPRAEGDAVSRYGMGMSLAQLPAAWMAPRIEARLGPGASQPLFLIVPLLCVCAAAAAAGWIALGLGLSAGGVAAAVCADGSRLSSWILRVTRSVRAAPGRRSRTEPGVQPDISPRVGGTRGPAAATPFSRAPPRELRCSRNQASRLRYRSRCCRCSARHRRSTQCALSLRWRVWRSRSQVGISCRDRKVRTALRILRRRGIHASMAGWILETARWSRIEGWGSTFLRSSSRCWPW